MAVRAPAAPAPCLLACLLTAVLGTSAAAAPPQVSAAAPHLALGESAQLELTVTPTRPEAVVRALASVGTLEPQGATTGPQRRFLYRPPAERVPRVALLAFWEEGGNPLDLAVHRLPLHGRLALRVSTRPGAEVTVQVAGRDFGPVRAPRAGAATVEVEVPPGVGTAQVRARSGRLEKTTQMPLEVPAVNPLLAFLAPPDLQEGRPSHLWVLHTGTLRGPMLEFSSRGLKLERVRFLRDRALFRVERVQDGRAPHLEVRVGGEPDAEAILDPEAR